MSGRARTGTVIAVVLLAANPRPAVVAVSPLLSGIVRTPACPASVIAGSPAFTVTVGRTRRQIGYACAGAVLYAIGFGGLLFVTAGPLHFLWAALLGLAQGITISLALVLILLRMPDAEHAARMSGMAQGIGYLLAAAGPVLAGAVHDATGGWSWPPLPLGVMLVPMAAAGAVAGRDVVLHVDRDVDAHHRETGVRQ